MDPNHIQFASVPLCWKHTVYIGADGRQVIEREVVLGVPPADFARFQGVVQVEIPVRDAQNRRSVRTHQTLIPLEAETAAAALQIYKLVADDWHKSGQLMKQVARELKAAQGSPILRA